MTSVELMTKSKPAATAVFDTYMLMFVMLRPWIWYFTQWEPSMADWMDSWRLLQSRESRRFCSIRPRRSQR
jgi:hypothetical protein